jgi:hypothetical protein
MLPNNRETTNRISRRKVGSNPTALARAHPEWGGAINAKKETRMMRILAPDLGKYKTVAGSKGIQSRSR